jgi:hypothetical protein
VPLRRWLHVVHLRPLAKLLKGRNEVQLKALLGDCTNDTIPFTALFFSKVKPRKFTQRPRLPEGDGA